MKRILFSAVGALGVAGMITMAAPASAAPTCESTTTPFTSERAACVAAANAEIFGGSIDPEYNLNVLINGTIDDHGKRSGLGLRDQLNGSTFTSSVGDFSNGPRTPSTAPDAATGSTPSP